MKSIASSSSIVVPKFRCFDPSTSYPTSNSNHRYINSSKSNSYTKASGDSMESSSKLERKIVTGDFGYVLEDVPHFTDYVPDLPVLLSFLSPLPSSVTGDCCFGKGKEYLSPIKEVIVLGRRLLTPELRRYLVNLNVFFHLRELRVSQEVEMLKREDAVEKSKLESDNIATGYPDPNQFRREFPQRKISAIRTFPPGCGRNAPLFSNEEYLKHASSEKGSCVGCERTRSEFRPYSERTIRNEADHAGEEVQDGYACRHSLMGLCRQEKQATATVGINVKKHKLVEIGKSIYAPSEKKQKTEDCVGVSTKKNMPPRGKVAFLDPRQIIAKHTVDKEDGNIINGCKSIDGRGRAIEAIEALKLYRKIFKEEEKKNLYKRIDIQAFNRLKMEIQGWDDSRKPILGSIPGVEVGARFQYRVELSVVGLHLHFQAGIEYLEKGGKIIATSIVASGGYDNKFDGPDVLVYCGQGGKTKKSGKGPKNHKLKRGNLALQNSFDEQNFVRVILGSKEVEDSDSINARVGKTVPYFVYNGLYLVEQWEELKESAGRPSIFKFWLRRLQGQPDLHLGKNSKKMEIH